MERPPIRLMVCLALVGATLLVYRTSLDHDFVHFDDDVFVLENVNLRQGLSPEGLVWSWGTYDATWMPVTWVSYLIDYQVGGRAPSVYHRTNLLIHCANAVLLFLALANMTRGLWRSAFVAAVFALHPLQVEPVAWVAGRKDLLAGFFAFATLLSYSSYVRNPQAHWRYLSVTVLLVLGLMSKSTLLALPFLLLLLDFWPLGRMHDEAGSLAARRVGRCMFEKLPWIVLGVGAITLSALAQQLEMRVTGILGEVPLPLRVWNALLGYAGYLVKSIWPTNLVVHYPHPRDEIDIGLALLAGLAIGVTSAWVLARARSQPQLAVGWFWFVGMLLPVIGLVDVGIPEAMADRYMYLAQVGLGVMLVWSVPDRFFARRAGRWWLGVAAVAVLASFAVVSHAQLRVWRNGVELFTHALAVTGPNAVASNAVGVALLREGRLEEASERLGEAARLAPSWAAPRVALGDLSRTRGDDGSALRWYRGALRAQAGYPPARIRLAALWIDSGRPAVAIRQLRNVEAMQLEQGMPQVHALLGMALAQTGKLEAAVSEYRQALLLDPELAEVRGNFGFVLEGLGRHDEALAELRAAQGLGLSSARIHLGLGAALAGSGRRPEAQREFLRAHELARSEGDEALVAEVEARRRSSLEAAPDGH